MEGQPLRVPVQQTDNYLQGLIFFDDYGLRFQLSTCLRFSIVDTSIVFDPKAIYFNWWQRFSEATSDF